MTKELLRSLAVVIGLGIFLTGCSANDINVEKAKGILPIDDKVVLERDYVDQKDSSQNSIPNKLKIVRTASIEMRVKDLESTVDAIPSLLKSTKRSLQISALPIDREIIQRLFGKYGYPPKTLNL